MMTNRIKHIFQAVLLLLIFVPSVARAQMPVFDLVSVKALIDDHKSVRSVLMARSTVEQANEVLHNYAQAVAVDYDSLNVNLDKYTKCFDIIDVIYNSGMAVMNVYTTTTDVSKRVSELEKLMEQFANQCASRGNIVSSDTLIIGACKRCVQQVISDGKSLNSSLVELGQYALGLRQMTTAQLLIVISSINDALDSIRQCVDHTYFFIYKYVTLRTHYYKRALYRSKTISEMCNDAFSRWRTVSKKVGY